jgi:hypothetical protein
MSLFMNRRLTRLIVGLCLLTAVILYAPLIANAKDGGEQIAQTIPTRTPTPSGTLTPTNTPPTAVPPTNTPTRPALPTNTPTVRPTATHTPVGFLATATPTSEATDIPPTETAAPTETGAPTETAVIETPAPTKTTSASPTSTPEPAVATAQAQATATSVSATMTAVAIGAGSAPHDAAPLTEDNGRSFNWLLLIGLILLAAGVGYAVVGRLRGS